MVGSFGLGGLFKLKPGKVSKLKRLFFKERLQFLAAMARVEVGLAISIRRGPLAYSMQKGARASVTAVSLAPLPERGGSRRRTCRPAIARPSTASLLLFWGGTVHILTLPAHPKRSAAGRENADEADVEGA
jgi:hypothetical protein